MFRASSLQKDDKLPLFSEWAGEREMYSPSYTKEYRKLPRKTTCGCLAGFPKLNMQQVYGACEQLEGTENLKSRRN
jgi:hypothetical protein